MKCDDSLITRSRCESSNFDLLKSRSSISSYCSFKKNKTSGEMKLLLDYPESIEYLSLFSN